MEKIKCQCPRCGRFFEIDKIYENKNVPCPNCGNSFAIHAFNVQPASNVFYVHNGAQILGPYSEVQIGSMLRQGSIRADVLVSTDMKNWFRLNTIPAYNQILAAQTATITVPTQVPIAQTNTVPAYSSRRTTNFPPWVFVLAGVLLFLLIVSLCVDSDDASQTADVGNPEERQPQSGQEQGSERESLSLPDTYEKYQQAVGLVTITLQDKFGQHRTFPVGTAFAVSQTTFLTNAHVAYGIKMYYAQYYAQFVDRTVDARIIKDAQEANMNAKAYAEKIGDEGIARIQSEVIAQFAEDDIKVRDVEIRLNHSAGKSFRVATIQVHSRYRVDVEQYGEYDVAAFEISGKTSHFFKIASYQDLLKLKPGMEVASAGFPMEGLNGISAVNVEKPEASFGSGIIKKVTDFENKDAGPENNKSITHTIPGAGGVSGSPMFLADGRVIGIFWGGHNDFLNGKRVSSGLLHNWAVRIDQIDGLGEPIPWKEWIIDPIKNVAHEN